MSLSSHIAFYQRRIEAEDRLAATAASRNAGIIHAQLARAYRNQLRRLVEERRMRNAQGGCA